MTVFRQLKAVSELNPNAIGIIAPGTISITYAQILEQIDLIVNFLQSKGVARSDRIAVVAPQGLEAAVVMLGVTSAATCVPLNPAYRARELNAYLLDLDIKAAVTPAGLSEVNHFCQDHNVPIFGLTEITSNVVDHKRLVECTSIKPDNVALILHTSGTTSNPKRVPLTHENLYASSRHMRRTLNLDRHDRCLNLMPLFHIHGFMAMLSSLSAGGCVILPTTLDVTQFSKWLYETQPTWYSAVPTIHQAILNQVEAGQQHNLRFIRSSSARLAPRIVTDLEKVFDVPVIEAYGMTEACHQITSNPLPPDKRKLGSVGFPTGSEVNIMDEFGQLLREEQVGEVVIRGPNVIQGYLDDSDSNKKAFENGWFRTGDEGWIDGDGYVYLTGRLKEMINRGGEKISPFEIEEILLEHEAVVETAVFAMPDQTYGEQVGAAVVADPAKHVSEDTLRNFAEDRMSSFKVPRRIIFVENLPRATTGKVQRIGLAKLLGLKLESSDSHKYVPPRNALENSLCQLWAKVLRVQRVGIHDQFLDVGGDSLLAAHLLNLIDKQYDVEIPLHEVFSRALTVEGIAKSIKTQEHRSTNKLHRISRDIEFPLYHTQQQDWVQGQLQTEPRGLIRTLALRLRGNVCLSALNRSLTMLVERHEALRMTFHSSGDRPVQRLNPCPQVVVEPESYDGNIESAIQHETRFAFDLEQFPLFRIRLIHKGATDHILLFIAHQLIIDGASLDILHDELTSLYEAELGGNKQSLPKLPISFADHAAQWKTLRNTLTNEEAYWREQLGEKPPELTIPTDFLRPSKPVFRNSYLPFNINETNTEALRSLARQNGGTLFTSLMAGFVILLHRYTQSTDLIIGTVSTGRMTPSKAGIVGPMHNLLPIRTNLSGNPTVNELLGHTRDQTFGALVNQEFPFPEMLRSLRRERDGTPLVRALLVLKQRKSEYVCDGLRVTRIEVNEEHTPVDLSLELFEEEKSLKGSLAYLDELFENETAKRLIAALESIFNQMIEDPDRRLSEFVLPEEERRLLRTWTVNEDKVSSETTLHESFEGQSENTPEATALFFDGSALSYRHLDRKSNQIANHLIQHGVTPGSRVGLFLDYSLELIPALLGILKAGGAVVPLHWAHPPQAHLKTIREASVAHILSNKERSKRLPDFGGQTIIVGSESQHEGSRPDVCVAPDDTAVIFFTSGSTGKPKGAVISHRSLVHHSQIVSKIYELTPQDRVLQFSSLSADLAMEEIFPILFTGGTVVVRTAKMIESPSHFLNLASRWDITVFDLQTRYWHEFAPLVTSNPRLLPPQLRLIMVGGERPHPAQLSAWMHAVGDRVRLLNCYGPTEATIMVTLADMQLFDQRKQIPIGWPLSGVRLYIVDTRLNLVPIGAPGELLIGGVKIAGGYLNDAELTEKHFIPDPFLPNACVFRTGDRVRLRNDAMLEFLGRLDDQVKIRGFRTEPAEVEYVLATYHKVADAAVLVSKNRKGEAALDAYAVPKPGMTVSPDDLMKFLRNQLPFYQVPQAIEILERLPLSRSGKVNHSALPKINNLSHLREVDNSSAVDELSTKITEIVGEILEVNVKLSDDFFAVGGDSLQATRVITRIRDLCGVHLPLIEMFDRSSLSELTERVRELINIGE